jgi:hypothetical protein
VELLYSKQYLLGLEFEYFCKTSLKFVPEGTKVYKHIKYVIRGIGVAACAVIVALLVWYASGDIFPPPFQKGKISFMEMVTLSSGAREAFKKCWIEERSIEVCDNVFKEAVRKLSSPKREFCSIGKGEMVGIDYTNRVFLLFMPSFVEGELRWDCLGSPPEVLPKLCVPVNDGNSNNAWHNKSF